MSEVFFFDYSKNQDPLRGVEKLFHESNIARAVSRGDSVAVKVHMGELGNITYLRPIFTRKVVELIKNIGGKPFVTDTTTLYPRKRFTARDYLETAAQNGFTPKSVGAPILIADGERGYDGVPASIKRTVNGCKLTEIKVASAIAKADALIVISHVKGHELSGFGGAIKNVAMGCVTKEGKATQHAMTRAALDASKCDGCGKCIEACFYNALTMVKGKPVRSLKRCLSCNNCFSTCPRKAYHIPKGARDRFQVYLAHAAFAVLSLFENRKVGYLNFAQDVTPLCDCCTPAGNPVTPNIGILASPDPVAVDKASMDLIDKAPLIVKSLRVRSPDRFGEMHGTSSLIHLRTAQKLGLGNLNYRLVFV